MQILHAEVQNAHMAARFGIENPGREGKLKGKEGSREQIRGKKTTQSDAGPRGGLAGCLYLCERI